MDTLRTLVALVISIYPVCLSFLSACSVLGVAQLDSVIIASPPIEDGVNLSLEHLQPYWEELENLVQSKKIVAIGTSDLDKTQLEQLYQWAQVKDVDPGPWGGTCTLQLWAQSACSPRHDYYKCGGSQAALSPGAGVEFLKICISNCTEY